MTGQGGVAEIDIQLAGAAEVGLADIYLYLRPGRG